MQKKKKNSTNGRRCGKPKQKPPIPLWVFRSIKNPWTTPWKSEEAMFEPECRAAWEEEWMWFMSLLQWCLAPLVEYGIFQKANLPVPSLPFPLVPCFPQPFSSQITFWTPLSFSSAPSNHSLQLSIPTSLLIHPKSIAHRLKKYKNFPLPPSELKIS